MTKSAPEGCCWGVGESWPRTTFLRPLGVFVQLWLVWARILPAAVFALGFLLSPAMSKSQGKRQYIFLSHCEHWRALLFALQLILLLLIHFYIWNEEVTEESQRAHINLVCCFVWGSPHNSWATKSNRLAYQYGWDCYILSYECPEIKLSC